MTVPIGPFGPSNVNRVSSPDMPKTPSGAMLSRLISGAHPSYDAPSLEGRATIAADSNPQLDDFAQEHFSKYS